MSEDGSHVISGFAGMILQHFLSKDPQSICVKAGSFEHGCSMRFYADHTQVHASNPPAEKKTCWLKPPMLQKWANYPSESRLKRPRHTRMKSWQRFHTRLSRKGPLRQPAMIWSPSPPGAPPCRFGWEPLSRQGAAPPWQQPWAS